MPLSNSKYKAVKTTDKPEPKGKKTYLSPKAMLGRLVAKHGK